jgi:diaminohydroxyphosphoribosylaminopyrimidine deaminase/5-amino-6-(5-phosphoribosylamino)uracil reductase
MDKRAVMLDLIERASSAAGRVRTNPCVGAALVRDGSVKARSIHERYGTAHAEQALFDRLDTSSGGTLFCTLEPCIHRGKTAPCLNRVARRNVDEVILASRDPHPAVDGGGIRALRRLGIPVETGVASEAYEWVNRAYFHGARTGFPWIDAKSAMSADGYIAPRSGDSRWITGEKSREKGHEIRSRVDGVMVGANTLRRDDPRLTDRVTDSDHQPRAIVVCREPDNLPLDSHLMTDRAPETILVCADGNDADLLTELDERGVTILRARVDGGGLNWTQTLPRLRRLGLGRVLVEGGGVLLGSLLEAGYVQQMHLFYSGKVFGGGTGAYRLESVVHDVEDSPVGPLVSHSRLGQDVYVSRLMDTTRSDELLAGHRDWRSWLDRETNSEEGVS